MNDRRLLILGAGHYQIPVIRRAIELGCTVITADYLPANPGHRLAAASEIVSTVDEEAILEVARKHRIDGVLTYGSDVSAPAVAYVAKKLNLPGNPHATARLLQRKDLIRELQQRLGLPHPRFATGATAKTLAEHAASSRLPFPALLKPADSSGSKGQTVARNADELRGGFEAARAFSRCGIVIAEEVLPQEGEELVFEALIRDGQLVFAHHGHNWFCDAIHPRVPAGEIVPSMLNASLTAEADRQIQALVTAAGVETGCMNFDAMLSDGRIVLLDVGLRNGGNFVPEIVRLSTGVDLTTAAIHSALGIPFDVSPPHAADAKCVVSQVIHSHVPGRFRRVRIDAVVEPSMISMTIFAEPGQPVMAYERGDAAVGVLIFEQPDAGTAAELLRRIPHPCVVDVDQAG